MRICGEPDSAPGNENRRVGLSAAAGSGAQARRDVLPFRSVNRPRAADYSPGMQRHHVLPCQVGAARCFSRLFDAIGTDRAGLDDFRRNGVLLPATEANARLLALPLHRGPHRHYSSMVMMRIGRIEQHWSRERLRGSDRATVEAAQRVNLLRRALRKGLLDPRRGKPALNRRDPALAPDAFSELDAMADLLWAESAD